MLGKLRNMTSLYLINEDKILLLYRQGSRVVNNVWTGSAGGHFEKEELNDAKACILREMNEELGLTEKDIERLSLRYITLRQTKGEIRQNYYFFANIKSDIELDSNEGILKWFTIEELRGLEMPYTARYVMEHYVEHGRFTTEMYAGIANEENVQFVQIQEF